MTIQPLTFYGLFTEDGLDQICYTAKEAKRETKDLTGMGLTVRSVVCQGADAELLMDAIDLYIKVHGRFPTAKAISNTIRRSFPTVTIVKG